MNKQLPLHEEVMLLALRDEKGTIDSKAQFYPQIIAGAIISELLLTGFITISNDKKQLVEIAKESLTGNEVLEEALYKMSNKDKPQELKYWLMNLAGISKLKNNMTLVFITLPKKAIKLVLKLISSNQPTKSVLLPPNDLFTM